MEAVHDDGFTPNDEVDAVRWMTIEAAGEQLSYRHDVEVLDSFVDSGATDR
jgi:hypothetical protein